MGGLWESKAGSANFPSLRLLRNRNPSSRVRARVAHLFKILPQIVEKLLEFGP